MYITVLYLAYSLNVILVMHMHTVFALGMFCINKEKEHTVTLSMHCIYKYPM